jgi:hypothetical protein
LRADAAPDSGKWEQRGRRKGQFVMARHRDLGSYAIGNVRVCSITENSDEAARHMSDETREKKSASAKRQSAETRQRISKALRGRIISAETRKLMSEAAKTREARHRATRGL